MKFLDKYNFFSKSQFGFRSGKSTDQALHKFCNEIWDGINGKNISMALFIDITKAFDTVDHKILLRKLYDCGFRGSTFNWFKSYLTGRSQSVKIGQSHSEPKSLSLGVPQGSVLGPILFLIYINSIFSLPLKSKITGFADDMACTYQAKSMFELSCYLNSDLEILRHWFKSHKLVISVKTKLMLFNPFGANINFFDHSFTFHSACCKKFSVHNDTCSESLDYNLFNNDECCSSSCFVIEFVKTYKYLGITIDDQLNWNSHIKDVKLYLRSCTRLLFILKPLCSQKLLKMIYYGLCHSKIGYGILCWGSTSNENLSKILIVQKHLVRLIKGCNRFEPSFPLFCSLNILPVRHLYYFNTLKLFFSNSFQLSHRNFSTYGLRSNSNLSVNIPRHRFTKFLSTFKFLSPRLYNTLPRELKLLLPTKSSFKKIKLWLLSYNHDDLKNLLQVIV